MFRRTIVSYLCIAAAALLIVPAVNAGTLSFDKAYDVSPGTRLEILNRDGSIDIDIKNPKVSVGAEIEYQASGESNTSDQKMPTPES